jgi:hypothetical protein
MSRTKSALPIGKHHHIQMPSSDHNKSAMLERSYIQKQLETIAPQLVVVFPDTIAASQLQIWEPYLLACNYRTCVCAKSAKHKTVVSRLPIFYQDAGFTINHLRGVKSIQVFLYVTNRPNNFNYLNKFPHIKHVFVGHGDSEKDASASRFCKVYDYLLVADRNAYERYAKNNVNISRKHVLMMGGPTLPGLVCQKTKQTLNNILYAPTFEGKSEEKNYSSLAKIANYLEDSVKTGQYSFCFRPHPGTGQRLKHYSGIRDSLRQLTTPLTPQTSTKVEQFNWADALVTDISGVLSEFLFTGKPIVVPAGPHDTLTLRAVHGTTLRKHVYVWDYTLTSLDAFMLSIAHDPLFDARHKYRNVKFRGAVSFEESAQHFKHAMRFLLSRNQQAARSPVGIIKTLLTFSHGSSRPLS